MIKQVSYAKFHEYCYSQYGQALVHASAERAYSEIKYATWVLLLIPERRTLDANGRRSGLVFFGTPHKWINRGHTGLLETMFSNLFCSGVREILPSLQLDLEALATAFRHQVEDYKFVSFYSDTDQVRNQPLSIIGADSLDFKCRSLMHFLDCPIRFSGIRVGRPPRSPSSPQGRPKRPMLLSHWLE